MPHAGAGGGVRPQFRDEPQNLLEHLPCDGDGTWTLWASYGDQEIAEYQGTASVALTRRFVYGPGLDEPVAAVSATNARTYQFQDALGSVILATNASGLMTERYRYTAHGVTLSAGANTAAYRYTGRRWDAETGLYHYRARAYSPGLGRFLQTDPIGTDGGIDLYAYVGNDPLNLADPTGLASLEAMFRALGLNIRNAHLAGTTHPITGIPFPGPFPDFSSVAKITKEVQGLTGNRTVDAALANAAAGLEKTPAGFTWHHVEDTITMQLVPQDIHAATGHTGGATLIKAGGLAAGAAAVAASTSASASPSMWDRAVSFAREVFTDPTTYMPPGLGTFLSVMRPSPAK